ncbi:MAG: topoisomerase IV, partial [Planctomycetaceae bacterium]|nr:topoisomerase IV [Planctomycetaceae bacterium]
GRMHLNDPCPIGDAPSPAQVILPIEPPPRLLAVSSGGRIAQVRWEFAGQQPGPIERFLPTGLDGDPIVSLLSLPSQNVDDLSLGLLSSDGRFKRLPLSEVVDLSGRATSVLKLKEGIELNSAVICREEGTLVLISDIGRLLRLRVTEDSLPLMGRLAQGPMTMRLLPGEQIVGAVCTEQTPLMMFSQRGLIGRVDCSDLRYNQRGDLGSMAVQVDAESDRLVGISAGTGLVGIRTNKDRHGRFDPEAINISQPGEKLIEQTLLQNEETIVEVIDAIQSNL